MCIHIYIYTIMVKQATLRSRRCIGELLSEKRLLDWLVDGLRNHVAIPSLNGTFNMSSYVVRISMRKS